MPFKVHEVVWNGMTFRSKTEAKTAVILNELGVEFEFEPSCVELQCPGGKKIKYLPDFWLHDEQAWLEIKNMGSVAPTIEECQKAHLLAVQSGKPCFLLFGNDFGLKNFKHGCCYKYDAAGTFEPCWQFAECPSCKHVGLAHRGRVAGLNCACHPAVDFRNSDSARIKTAIRHANQHHFAVRGW